MEVFDLHADIGYDVLQKRKKGFTNILNTFHVEKLRKGGITFINMACYFEGHETWQDMQTMVLLLKEEIDLCDSIDLVENRDQLFHINGHIKAILSVEGMCGIQEDVPTKIDWLYQQGIRIASLCWNDENALATGVKGECTHGLKALGEQAVETMITFGMIIDVSHANEKTFWDIMRYPQAIVMATHSNARMLCDHPRNLWDDQIKAIKEHHGMIGIVSAPPFVSSTKETQDIAHMLAHAKHIADIIGYDRVGFGLDYMDFYEGYETFHVQNLEDASKSLNLIEGMQLEAWEKQHIQMIALGNTIRFLNEHL